MKLSRLFGKHVTAEEARQRFVNVVDEALMARIEEQRERLRTAGVEVKPVRRAHTRPVRVA